MGAFFFGINTEWREKLPESESLSLPSYTKPWLSFDDQIKLLQSRGLIIQDKNHATEFLKHVNYRFSGYCLAFETSRHQFELGITFEQIESAYEFDRVLRDIITEALEVVELDIRCAIAHYFGEKHGPFGHTNPSNFFEKFRHSEWLESAQGAAKGSREKFVLHFRSTYKDFPNIPIWMMTELISFGALSKMFQGMLPHDRQAISSRCKIPHRILGSWIHHLVYVRNLCAHHSRLWDRNWSIKPEFPNSPEWKPPLLFNLKFHHHFPRKRRWHLRKTVICHCLCSHVSHFFTDGIKVCKGSSWSVVSRRKTTFVGFDVLARDNVILTSGTSV